MGLLATLLLTAVSPAQAAGPSLEASVYAAPVRAEQRPHGGFGLAAGFGRRLGAQLRTEVDIGAQGRFAAIPAVTLASHGSHGGLAMWAGYGLAIDPSADGPPCYVDGCEADDGSLVHGVGELGAGVDFRGSKDVMARLFAAGLLWNTRPERAHIGVALIWRPTQRERRPKPVVVEAPPPPEGPKLWVPDPVCDWVPESDINRRFSTLNERGRRAILDIGFRPKADIQGESTRGEGTGSGASSTDAPAAPEAARGGSIVVASSPGDAVQVDGVPLSLGPDGVGVANAAQGAHEVTVLGGGRDGTWSIAVQGRHAVWVRTSDPVDLAVHFAIGSAQVAASDRAAVLQYGELAGNHKLRVAGSSSPEGSLKKNLELAKRRAGAAAALLEEAGVPAEYILVETEPPDPNKTPAQQRQVHITSMGAR